MRQIYLVLPILTASLLAYTDSDMDGVEDQFDQCPQTLLSDLVDLNGCVIHSTGDTLHFDLILGAGYSPINYASQKSADTFSLLLQSDLYWKEWWLQASTSRYQTNSDENTENGWDDTAINLLYRFVPSEKFSFHTGIGAVLPTYKSGYNNEAIDYSFLSDFQYSITDKNALFGGYRYTWVNDTDTNTLRYQNTHEIHLGLTHQLSSISNLTISYHHNESIYKEIEAIRTIGIGYNQELGHHWFLGVDYNYGLSDSASDNAFSGQIGYYF